MSTVDLLDRMFQSGAKAPAALLANIALSFEGRDGRRFSVDEDGAWVNRQPKATFVSPGINAIRYDCLKAETLKHWCHTYTPNSGDIVFDVGSGIGNETVIFSRLAWAGHVYSVEAHPQTFACLEKTVALSRLRNATALPCAIMDKDGEVSISDGPHLTNTVLGGGGISIPARSIASLCAELAVPRIDFLKMNIEGAEGLAIHGFGAVDIRHLVIDCHDFIADAGRGDFYRTKDAVRQFLCNAGFRITERSEERLPWLRDRIYADRG